MSSTCLTDDAVLAFVLGDLAAEAAMSIELHLAGCAGCRTVVTATARFLDRGGAPDESIPGEVPPTGGTRFAAGASVGRYLVSELLGAGAAGVVYAAQDPQLKRRVALKILPASDEASRTRWLREAEAMAQLAHPNVVNVHDAFTLYSGTLGGFPNPPATSSGERSSPPLTRPEPDAIVIVMELVAGRTLAAWLKERTRSWQEILAAFRDGGRGLAAAHAAGLVHRDFKPENVLVGEDGRVRVGDFGLAQAAAPPASTDAPALVGTPAFMAPEQFMGRGADPRSDQFSFCVALYVALYGRRPFVPAGSDEAPVAALARAVLAGNLRPPPAGSRVPPRVFAALRRGLEVAPDQRHPSIDHLLVALTEAETGRGASRWLAAAGVLAVAASALVLVALGGPRCGDGKVGDDEECDDGNTADGDGCLGSCRLARCGDGRQRSGVEECDDGNTADGDGCSGRCLACGGKPDELFWPDNGHCYTMNAGPLSWSDARVACERQGDGDLVTFAAIYEANALSDAFFGRVKVATWIGLADLPGRREFRWVTGEPITVNFWPGYTPAPDRHGCILQDPATRVPRPTEEDRYLAAWDIVDCARPLGYVCERRPALARPRDRRAYRAFFRERPWYEARAACAALGGHLATITDADEHAFLAAHVAREFWIGASDDEREGSFRWITGEPLAFHVFAPGEPDNESGNSDCVWVGTDRVWHDRPCAQKAPYVCELE